MATDATSDDSPLPSTSDTTDNNLQPFFVLRKTSCSKREGKSARPAKTRRRIDMSTSLHKTPEKSVSERVEDCDDSYNDKSRMEAFEIVWSKIELTAKDVLREINTNVFSEIYGWVCESFNTIRSFGSPGFLEATRPFPILTDTTSKQVFTGLVLTKNMEFVDDLLTFEELGSHLKSQGCHVANLSSSDLSTKNGVGGCLRSLLRQLLMTTIDAAEMCIIASWYRENGNDKNPVVIIIDDIERCSGPVLSEVIVMLSEWAVKLPVIIIMGVSTTLDAPRNILPTKVLHYLSPHKFTLGTPAERMDAVVEAVLVKQCSGFSISHKVALFMRNYFLSQDGTLTCFMKAIKIACAHHFSREALSFITDGCIPEVGRQVLLDERCEILPTILKHAFNLPSYDRNKMAGQTGESLANGLLELKRLQNLWSMVVLCLYEAGKYDKLQLLDLLCEALDPNSYHPRASDSSSRLQKDSDTCLLSVGLNQQYFCSRKGGYISQALRKVRDLSATQLSELLKIWKKLTVDVIEIHDKVKELQSLLDIVDSKLESVDISKKPTSRSHLKPEDIKSMNEKAGKLLECMMRDYLQPIECIPFHEIVCFKNVDELQSALVGDSRRRIQVDLLDFHNILKCTCCSRVGNTLLPSMHDTSIMYTLAQEHGDLINLHDWYKSFKSAVLSGNSKGKQKLKQSTPKKKNSIVEAEIPSEALIQARFCRAVTELQIAGLLRMPTKRRPDFVQRVAFGL